MVIPDKKLVNRTRSIIKLLTYMTDLMITWSSISFELRSATLN
jgi:hypothetical protein